jgi:hypothetical protein
MALKFKSTPQKGKKPHKLPGDMNGFLHRPLPWENKDATLYFAKRIYPELNEMYYETVRNWMPKKVQ